MKTAVKENGERQWLIVCIWIFTLFYGILNQGAYFARGLFSLAMLLSLYALFYKGSVRTDIFSLGFLIIFALAAISAVVYSIDAYTALTELCKYYLLFIAYIILINSNRIREVEKIFYWGMVFIMLFGLLSFLGINIFPAMLAEKSGRLQSFLQYANTTALFMGIGVLLSVDRFIKNGKKRYVLLGVLFAAALILTRSRTTLVVFIVILVVYTFFSLKGKQKIIFFAALSVLAAGAAAVGGRLLKISLTEPTLIERVITYSDGFKSIFKSFFGIGLGNWQYLQFGFQSAPYQVRYIHNAYLQIGLDCGFFAMLAFTAVPLGLLILNLKRRNIYFYITLLILIHSFFEINLNYGFFLIYFALCLVLLNQNESAQKDFTANKKVYKAAKNILFILLIALLFVLLLSVLLFSAGKREAVKNSKKAISLYNKAFYVNPLNSEILFEAAKSEHDSDKAMDYLKKSLEINPYQFNAIISVSEGLRYKGDYEGAIEYAERLYKLFPYSKKHQQLLNTLFDEAYEHNKIGKEEYESRKKSFDESVMAIDAQINPLYKYINPEFKY